MAISVFVALSMSVLLFIGMNESPESILQKFLDDYGEEEYFTGLQFTMIKHSSKNVNVTNVGYTSTEKSFPVSNETMFGWGSITKEFTAALLLRLQGEGKLTLTNTLFEVAPEGFESPRMWPEAWKEVKLYELFNMTSGIPDYSIVLIESARSNTLGKPFEEVLTLTFSIDEVIDFTANFQNTQIEVCEEMGSCFTPGSRFNYTSTGYYLAAYVIEKFSGETFASQLEKHVLSHVGPEAKVAYGDGKLPESVMPYLAHGYSAVLDPLIPAGTDGTAWSWSLMGPGGGLLGNGIALSELVHALYTGQILDEALTEHFYQDYLVNIATGQLVKDKRTQCSPVCYGLGVGYEWSPVFGDIFLYLGEPLQYMSFYVYLPCYDATFALSKNSSNPNLIPFPSSLFEIIEEMLANHDEAFGEQVYKASCPQSAGNQFSLSQIQLSELESLS